ncbi:leucine-rich repeat-containing protein 42 isoform X2 [Protopterus annectens]|nr:leucine-rich repeat-containing protein 42 isoform X2 [Protopterus annectens]XP_043941411.1 leucine-rich repeat-containing protein 42 isoform X2 [Protopterus annectens]XP_043941412.1 leucine-rich repeat-containing protein 42 isoform X2 [Protopterus annectens]XP_043941413.1 leucine-rich repeat-containing protein 42 isoform X2 [Protopterus annectens]XP_043941414.1 leucine-rich repeat-containing protein 42 isoform X2 [Protopterus annectens]XP_043941415.1 leucine-rich repeat-containing protein 4
MYFPSNAESSLDFGPVYVRENGELHILRKPAGSIKDDPPKTKPYRLFQKSFSVELCVGQEDSRNNSPKAEHFIFTYTTEGSLRYSAKSLFHITLGFVADNVHHIDSLVGFPEQIAEKLFTAAEERLKFTDPRTGLRALQVFTKAYGHLVLQTLCLRGRYLTVSEKLDEIRAFHGLTCLDLSSCKLGDDHELIAHLTSEALCSLKQLYVKDNCLSDMGIRKLTAPVRVMKRGLEKLESLDVSCNANISDFGIGFLCCFKKLQTLDISNTGVKDKVAVTKMIQNQLGLVPSDSPLKEFDHTECRSKGWAEQVVAQWQDVMSETCKPHEHIQSRLAAQQFYGKMKILNYLPYNSGSEETVSLLHFYREKQNLSAQSAREVTVRRDTRLKNKRLHEDSTKEQNPSSVSPSLKRTYAAEFSLEDWDLLNSY